MKKYVLSTSWILTLVLATSIPSFSQVTYTWDGSANNKWIAAANWNPVRSTPLSTDVLLFDVGRSAIVTDVPAETVGTLIVTNNTSLDLQANSPVAFSITTLLQVDAGSFISFSSNGNTINVNTPGTINMGGTITMYKGTFNVQGSGVLTLSGALTTVNGQYALGTSSTLNLGSGGSSSRIQLPDNIFVSSPTIANLTVNNPNGVTLGAQSITVTNSLSLVSGILTSNAAGRIILGSNAISPVETSTSYIQGYVQLQSKNIGTGELSFMGLNIAPGVDNIGNVTIIRRTGTAGMNSFNGGKSVASTWEISAGAQPTSGRSLSLSWVSANDNTNNASLRFQVYRYGSGPSWQAVGPLTPLASNAAGVRTTATVTTTEFSDWTVSDEKSPLPVQWLDFYGHASSHEIAMEWQTATEENTDFFDVEKLIAENKFVSVGKRQAAGNSKAVKHYSFVDYEPTVGVNYYRIKQVDLDGKFSYSKVINIPFATEKNSTYSVYPVPAQDFIYVKRAAKPGGNETLTLYDQFGKIVHTQPLCREEITRVNNLNVPTGMYRLEIAGPTTTYSRKIIVKK